VSHGHDDGYVPQPPLQLEASRRRSRVPPTPPVIGDSWSDEGGESKSSAALSSGICQPLAVESMARRTSTRPIVLGEEDVPRNACTASVAGAAATVASRVPMSFGYACGPFEGDPERSLASAGVVRGLVGRIGPMR